MNIRLLYMLAFACTLAATEQVLYAIPSSEKVQENAEDVFSRPEFSRLQKLQRSKLVREDISQRNGGNGDGPGEGNRPGNGDGDGNRQGRNRGDNDPNGQNRNDRDNQDQRERNARNENRQRQTDSSFSPSASFGGFGQGMAGLFKLLGVLAICVMVVLIVIMIVKSFQDRESRLDAELTGTFQNDVGELETEHPPGEYPSDDYLRRAAEFARQGAFREAVAFVLLGAMSELESRGLIRYRKGLTQRDYYRTVRRHDKLGPAYRSLLKLYEPLGFGRRTAELAHYQSAVKSFTGGFRDRAAVSEV